MAKEYEFTDSTLRKILGICIGGSVIVTLPGAVWILHDILGLDGPVLMMNAMLVGMTIMLLTGYLFRIVVRPERTLAKTADELDSESIP